MSKGSSWPQGARGHTEPPTPSAPLDGHQRPRGGFATEKTQGPMRAPRGHLQGPGGSGPFPSPPPEGPKGSQAQGQQVPVPLGTPAVEPEVLGGTGPFPLRPRRAPGLLGPSGGGREDGGQLVETKVVIVWRQIEQHSDQISGCVYTPRLLASGGIF